MRRELEPVVLQVSHEHLHLGREDLHGVDVDVGSNFTTSLYKTTTMIISRNTKLVWTIRSFIRRLRSRPSNDSIISRRITPPSRIGIGMMFSTPRFRLINAMKVSSVAKPAS